MVDISSSRSASGLTDKSKRRMAQRTVQCKNAVVIENKVRKLSNSIRILSEFSPVMLCPGMIRPMEVKRGSGSGNEISLSGQE